MMKHRLFFAACSILLLSSSSSLVAEDCVIDRAIGWCTRDTGFNEGASCGLRALGGTGVPGLPQWAEQPVLGNLWKRREMFNACKSAWSLGLSNQAYECAKCCQIHNPSEHQCISRSDLRREVENWLSGAKP